MWENYRDTALKNDLLNKGWEPIRIHFDYSNTAANDMDFVKNDLMEPIKEVFQSFLNIKRDPNGVQYKGKMCVEAKVPGGSISDYNSDLYIFVTAKSSPGESFVAWASACHREMGAYRAVAG